jgi:hypothetical protein
MHCSSAAALVVPPTDPQCMAPELEDHGRPYSAFPFFATFFFIGKWVLLNLFIAVLLSSFETNFVLDRMKLQVPPCQSPDPGLATYI